MEGMVGATERGARRCVGGERLEDAGGDQKSRAGVGLHHAPATAPAWRGFGLAAGSGGVRGGG